LPRKLPELFKVLQIGRVVELQEQALVWFARVGLDRSVVEAEFFEVSEDHKEDSLGAPGVALSLEDVLIKRLGRRLGFYEEFGLTPGAESVIGIAGPVGFTALDENFALRVRQSGFVLDIPAERLEERGDQVHARLSFQVLREVVIPVGVELSEEPLEALCED